MIKIEVSGKMSIEAALKKGLTIDEFAPRLSFFFNGHSNFFEEVMVMDPNLELQQNRLALLKDLHQSMSMVADLSQLAQ